MSTFGTVGVAMITPFDDEGELDFAAARTVASYLVGEGVDCLVLSGTTGESPTTYGPEKERLIEEVRDEVGPDVLIVAGAGSNDTAHAVRMAKSAEKAGADGLLAVSPYYSRPSQEGIYQHFLAIADSTDLPVLLYDIPGRTGVKIADETLDRLAEHPKIKGVKDAVGKLPQGLCVMRRTGLEYYSGDDDLNMPWLTGGASGIVSVVGHVAAGKYKEMTEAVAAGDLARAQALEGELHPLVNAIMGGGQGAVMAKEALHLLGVLPNPTPRLPLVRAPQEDIDALEEAMAELGYLSGSGRPAQHRPCSH